MRILPFLLAPVVLILASFTPPAASSCGDGIRFWDAVKHAANGMVLFSEYSEEISGDLVDQVIIVRLARGPVDTALTVSVENTFIGTMTTNSLGQGWLRLQRRGQSPDQDCRAPKPRVEPGDEIKVSDGKNDIRAIFQERP